MEPQICLNTLFMDVDYPQLMQKKCNVILQQRELLELFHGIEDTLDSANLYLKSKEYLALGCDLRNVEELVAALKSQLAEPLGYTILFVAEVSMTYMDVAATDALLTALSLFIDGNGQRQISAYLVHFVNEL